MDWAIAAAWAQAVLSGAAIFVAVWLQDRDAARRRRDTGRMQLEAVARIAAASRRTLTNLDKRARRGELSIGKFGFYTDELVADLTAISAIDLTSIQDPRLTIELLALRQAVTSANRRLQRWRPRLAAGRIMTPDKFSSLAESASGVHARLINMASPSGTPALPAPE